MSWPLSQDYNEAIQSPATSFSDPELQQGEVVCNALGIPMLRSGNFADVYEVRCPNGSRWAIKCFTRQVAGLRERYQEISFALQEARLPFTVEFTYQQEGIRIHGQWFPILKMQWVEGLTFNDFVRQNLDKPAMLEGLLQIWGRMAQRLRAAGIAHADLQHGNVLLVLGSTANTVGVKLIDYDGMFVPALAGKPSGEVGHPSYQHPLRLREGTYSPEVDRFPVLVVATALRALCLRGRSLWEKYDNGDNLLFKETDLRKPERLALFKDLLETSDPQTKTLASALFRATRGKLEDVPLIEELLPQAKPAPISVPTVASVPPKSLVPVKGPPPRVFRTAFDVAEPNRTLPNRKGLAHRSGVPLWGWIAGGVIAAVLFVSMMLVVLLRGGRTHPKEQPPIAEKWADTERSERKEETRNKDTSPKDSPPVPDLSERPDSRPGWPQKDKPRTDLPRPVKPAPLDCTGPEGISAEEVRKEQEAWAAYLKRDVEETVEIVNGVKMTFVLVPPGKFWMGSPEDEADRVVDETLHDVTLTKPFYLGRYAVTQEQYEALTGKNPSKFKGTTNPVDHASWADGLEFAATLTKKLNDKQLYRLPTEAEWEYACRAGRPSSKPFGVGDGRTLSSRDANIDGTRPYGGAAPGPSLISTSRVGSYSANALGLFDMHGNVWQWCADWYGPYPVGGVIDPTGPPKGADPVTRGGDASTPGGVCRAARRGRNGPSVRGIYFSFRLARSLPSELPGALPSDDPRLIWRNKTGLRYAVIGQDWSEITPDGKQTAYVEVARNKDYIELRKSDGVYVRIHSTVYYWGTTDRKKGVRSWSEWLSPDEGQGSWLRPDDQRKPPMGFSPDNAGEDISDTRRIWATKNGRRFEHLGRREWKEISPDSKQTAYVEVARNKDYIELRKSDGVYVRIHSTVYYWGTTDRKKGVRSWSEWLSPDEGQGSWLRP